MRYYKKGRHWNIQQMKSGSESKRKRRASRFWAGRIVICFRFYKDGDGLLSGDICPPGGAPGTQPLSPPLSAGQFSFLNLAQAPKPGCAQIRGWECRIEK